ncbi:MAG TPA: hypothetical protein VNA69_08185 [Thermoanaerobaculia bacterium]|nr:hypothetical protein [Thermoanaerobaculia bacterium]
MFKKLKRSMRHRRMMQVIRNHASEIMVGVLMGLLTDLFTDYAHSKLKKAARRL